MVFQYLADVSILLSFAVLWKFLLGLLSNEKRLQKVRKTTASYRFKECLLLIKKESPQTLTTLHVECLHETLVEDYTSDDEVRRNVTMAINQFLGIHAASDESPEG